MLAWHDRLIESLKIRYKKPYWHFNSTYVIDIRFREDDETFISPGVLPLESGSISPVHVEQQ